MPVERFVPFELEIRSEVERLRVVAESIETQRINGALSLEEAAEAFSDLIVSGRATFQAVRNARDAEVLARTFDVVANPSPPSPFVSLGIAYETEEVVQNAL